MENSRFKFRAWDSKYNEMILEKYKNERGRVTEILLNEQMGRYKVGAYRDFPFTFMLFTGLKDKNDIDVFEDDIIADDNLTFVVKWQSGGFVLSPIKFSKNAPFIGNQIVEMQTQAYISESCKIIGNIYQNSELLEGIQT